MNKEKNARKWLLLAVGLAVLWILCLIGYYAGYRFTENFSIGKVGTLSVTSPFPKTNIFVDGKQKITTSEENEKVEIKLSPRSHEIIVSHDGYFPWTKRFTMPSAGTVTLAPLFVTQNTSGLMIGTGDGEYWKIKNGIASDVLPSKAHPRTSFDKSTTLWVLENTIMVKTGEKVSTVIQPQTPVRNVDFYKNRNDTIIFSTATAVYVIETDTEGTQNFMPIYTGASPSFIKADNNFIYVMDGNALMQVAI